ncbi:MAG TPA: DUF1254 domain-containing protein [Bryobacteraceae bacterium]|nr:DUF1254 domain-containing protein [Bryobacteraceae bacterium]
MTGFLPWVATTLLLSGAFVLLFLRSIPVIITGGVFLGFRRKMEGKPWFNHLLMGGPAKSGDDRIVMTSPDMIYMLGLYDVRREPVVIHCAVPARDTYWCISLYRRNTDNFYVRNDRASKEREFDVVIKKPGDRYEKVGGEDVVSAPSSRGVVVIRAVIADRNDEEEIALVQATLKQTTMTPLSQWKALWRQIGAV